MFEDPEFEALWARRLAVTRMQREVRELKAMLKARREAFEQKYNFNPNQPRVPAGSPQGGEWTSAGGPSTRLSRVAPTPFVLAKAPAPEAKPSLLGKLSLARLVRIAPPLALTLPLSGDTPLPKTTTRILPGTTDLAFVHMKFPPTGREAGVFALVVIPEQRETLQIFGAKVTTTQPPRLQTLPVAVTIKNGVATYNAAELERAYGRPVVGLTNPGAPPRVSATPGSGIEIRDEEERSILESMRASGASSVQIQNALDAKRSGIRNPGERRNKPGQTSTSRRLANINGPWLTEEGDVGNPIPGQIARRLVGRQYKDFGEFRRDFWREVAATPHLASQFSRSNQKRMARGKAPFARKAFRAGKLRSFVLHHDPKIADWGDVYDMSSIGVMTPKGHIQAHKPSRKSREFATPPLSTRIEAMTTEEALATIDLLLNGDEDEARDWELLDALEEAFPHSNITDLLYWSEVELSPTQIVDEALRREREWAAKN